MKQAARAFERWKWVALCALVVVVGVAHPWVSPVQADAKDTRAIKQKMSRWKNELGLKNCAYCHVKEGRKFDYEAATPKKAIAHYCEENFVQKLKTESGKAVTCRTCHDRKAMFLPREGAEDSGEADEKVEGR